MNNKELRDAVKELATWLLQNGLVFQEESGKYWCFGCKRLVAIRYGIHSPKPQLAIEWHAPNCPLLIANDLLARLEKDREDFQDYGYDEWG